MMLIIIIIIIIIIQYNGYTEFDPESCFRLFNSAKLEIYQMYRSRLIKEYILKKCVSRASANSTESRISIGLNTFGGND